MSTTTGMTLKQMHRKHFMDACDEYRVAVATGKNLGPASVAVHAAKVGVPRRLWRMVSHIYHHTPLIPADFPVRPIGPSTPAKDRVTCGSCGLSWDDAIPTEWTPAPSARCPFEYFHKKEP